MKIRTKLLFLSLALNTVVVGATPLEQPLIVSQKKEAHYLKAIEVDPATGTRTLVRGIVTTGNFIFRNADGSCIEEKSVLLSLDDVETPIGKIQAPKVSRTLTPISCPQ